MHATTIDAWRPRPGARWFRTGDVVRLTGESRRRYKVARFLDYPDGHVEVELVAVRPHPQPGSLKVARVERMVRARRTEDS